MCDIYLWIAGWGSTENLFDMFRRRTVYNRVLFFIVFGILTKLQAGWAADLESGLVLI